MSWLRGRQKELHNEQELVLQKNNNDHIRHEREAAIKHCLKLAGWFSLLLAFFIFVLFVTIIISIFIVNIFKGEKSESIDFLFFECLKLVAYGIGSCLVKDAVKKKFDH